METVIFERFLLHDARTIEEALLDSKSKGEIFEDLGITFDYALPQNWLDDFELFCREYQLNISYNWILSSTVWAYPKGNNFGIPCFCIEEISRAYALLLEKRG